MKLSELMPADRLNDCADYFGYLYERWQDEKQYEDFAQYVAAMSNKLGGGVSGVVMTKRPWKIVFVLNGQKCYFQRRGQTIEYGTIGRPAPAAS